MELQIGVKALLKNEEGKYLLIRRSPEKYPEAAAQWDIVGGRIEPGTSLLENLRREIKEEVGLELFPSAAAPKLIAAQDILKTPDRHIVRLTYTAAISGEPKLSDEHSESGWFTPEEMRGLKDLDPYVMQLLTAGDLS